MAFQSHLQGNQGLADSPRTVPPSVLMLRQDVREPTSTAWHSHPRFQLLYAASGLVTVSLEKTTWVIPELHALLIPADTPHRAFCHSQIRLCTAYIEAAMLFPAKMRMLKVSPLLDASLQALAEEPAFYDCEGRGGCLAKLIVDEIIKAPEALFPLPLPNDSRLQKVCRSLLEDPSLDLDIDDWAETIGVSRRTLTRRFRTETQLSFAEWRSRLRTLWVLAKQKNGMSDKAAADATGYKSATTMRAMVRRTSEGP